jgi:hypothetical protein
MRIFALFEDPDAIQKARDQLEKDGRGDEVVKVVSPHLDRDQLSVSPVAGRGQGTTGAAVVNQAGQMGPQGTAGVTIAALGRLNLPPEHREYFERHLENNNAQVLVLETDDDAAEATKAMLKKVAARYVPRECVYRPKEGFSIPMKHWLKTDFRPLMEELLNPEQMAQEGLFQPETVRQLKAEHLANQANHSHVLWALMVFQDWRRRWKI